MLRSLKSVLGSSLIDDMTLIQRKRVALRDIIGMFLRHLKALVEQQLQKTGGQRGAGPAGPVRRPR